MTVCGEKVTGVCVAGKCPYFKRCHPVVWDKYGKIKPKTNEEWLQTCTTEQLVHVIHLMTTSCYVCGKEGVDYKRCYFHKKCTGPKEIEEWLKEPHDPFE